MGISPDTQMSYRNLPSHPVLKDSHWYNSLGRVPCFVAGKGTLHEARLYPSQPMNCLIVGFDKSQITRYLPDRFLIIDDGPIIDALELPKRRAVTVFDPDHHSFNPLKDIDYRRAREFLNVLDAVFPEGQNTLTKRNSNFVLLNALMASPKRLDSLVPTPDKKDTGALDAYQKVQTLLLSPVLERVLNRPTNMSLKGTVLARLDRAALGDFDSFVLANLLISQYDGPVVIPDFGFYASHPFHMNLIRQKRLIVGINSFDEVPRFKNDLLLFEQKIGRQCTPEDAKLLAIYEGIQPNTNAFNDFVAAAISPAA